MKIKMKKIYIAELGFGLGYVRINSDNTVSTTTLSTIASKFDTEEELLEAITESNFDGIFKIQEYYIREVYKTTPKIPQLNNK